MCLFKENSKYLRWQSDIKVELCSRREGTWLLFINSSKITSYYSYVLPVAPIFW